MRIRCSQRCWRSDPRRSRHHRNSGAGGNLPTRREQATYPSRPTFVALALSTSFAPFAPFDLLPLFPRTFWLSLPSRLSACVPDLTAFLSPIWQCDPLLDG